MLVYVASVTMLNQIHLRKTYHLIEPKWEINFFYLIFYLGLLIANQFQLSYPNKQDQMQQRLRDRELIPLV